MCSLATPTKVETLRKIRNGALHINVGFSERLATVQQPGQASPERRYPLAVMHMQTCTITLFKAYVAGSGDDRVLPVLSVVVIGEVGPIVSPAAFKAGQRRADDELGGRMDVPGFP